MQCHQYLRKIFAFVAIVGLIGHIHPVFAVTTFPDAVGTDYALAFMDLQERGVIQGYHDGLVRPQSPLNRVEALKILLEAEGGEQDRILYFQKKIPQIPLFSDISQSSWYAPYIEVAFEQGMITGYPDGTFQPSRMLTVAEAVVLLARTFDYEESTIEAYESPYIENRLGEWFTASVNGVVIKNLVMHKEALHLSRPITRGQFADMVYRSLHVRESGAIAYDGPEPSYTVVYNPASSAQYIAATNSTTFSDGQTGISVSSNSTQGGSGVQDSSTVEEAIRFIGSSDQTSPVPIQPASDHPYASEKYFAISMPSLGIEDLSIIHPQDAATQEGILAPLQYGVGHLFAYPGGGGKIMVYGHSSGYPWDVSEYTKIFRRINELEPGDRVYVTYQGKLHVYEVTYEETVLAKNATNSFHDEGETEELILFTCWPPDSIAERYLVHAVPVETIALQ